MQTAWRSSVAGESSYTFPLFLYMYWAAGAQPFRPRNRTKPLKLSFFGPLRILILRTCLAVSCPETALSLQVKQYTPPPPLKPPRCVGRKNHKYTLFSFYPCTQTQQFYSEFGTQAQVRDGWQ